MTNVAGYGIGTVNAITDSNLLEKMRISRLPSIVVVVEGRVFHYRGSMQRKILYSVFFFFFFIFASLKSH